MANDTNYWGLRPVKHISGAPWNGVTEKCYISSSYATAMYIGDPVMIDDESDDACASAMYNTIEKATVTDGGIIYGVIVSFDDSVGCSKVYNPASTERYANVCVDPTVVYHIRGCGGGTPTSLFPFLNAVMIAGTSSTVTGLSGVKLDEGTTTAPSVDQSNPLLILRAANMPDNELGDNCVWEVMINTHQLRAAATGNVAGVSKT